MNPYEQSANSGWDRQAAGGWSGGVAGPWTGSQAPVDAGHTWSQATSSGSLPGHLQYPGDAGYSGGQGYGVSQTSFQPWAQFASPLEGNSAQAHCYAPYTLAGQAQQIGSVPAAIHSVETAPPLPPPEPEGPPPLPDEEPPPLPPPEDGPAASDSLGAPASGFIHQQQAAADQLGTSGTSPEQTIRGPWGAHLQGPRQQQPGVTGTARQETASRWSAEQPSDPAAPAGWQQNANGQGPHPPASIAPTLPATDARSHWQAGQPQGSPYNPLNPTGPAWLHSEQPAAPWQQQQYSHGQPQPEGSTPAPPWQQTVAGQAGTSQASTDVYQEGGSYNQWDPQYGYQAYSGYQPGYDAYTGYGAYQTGYQDPAYAGYQQHQPGYAGYRTEAAYAAHQPQAAPYAGQPLPWGHPPQPVQQGVWSTPSAAAPAGPSIPVASTVPTKNEVDAADIFKPPSRDRRPAKIAVIMRGLPGSGKTFIAKALRDLEVSHGGEAPRIHALDDYFVTEVEKEVIEEEPGMKPKKQKVMVMDYLYEQELEESYKQSILKAFTKTVEEGRFPFVILDAPNIQVEDFKPFYLAAQRVGYEVYVLKPLETDPQVCFERNVHQREADNISDLAALYEPTPKLYTQLVVDSLFDLPKPAKAEADAIEEVDMEDQGAELQEDGEPKITSRWASLEEEEPEEEAPKKKKRRRDGPEPAAPAVAPDTNGKVARKQGGTSLLRKPGAAPPGKSVRWADQVEVARPEGFTLGSSSALQLETVHIVEGLGPGGDVGEGPLHASFEDQAKADRKTEGRTFRDILFGGPRA